MMDPKRLVWLAVGTLLCLTTSVKAKDDLPTTEKFSHYEKMVKRSPFAVATAGAPVAGTPDFAKDLYVANAAHSEEGDFVTVASTTNKDLKEYLNTTETIHGYSISNIQWSDQVGETKVTIAKDGQFATLTFNEALLSQAIPNPSAGQIPQPPRPGNVPGQPNRNPQVPIQRPMPVPQIPTPPPHTRPTIRRKVNPQQPEVQQPASDEDDEFENP